MNEFNAQAIISKCDAAKSKLEAIKISVAIKNRIEPDIIERFMDVEALVMEARETFRRAQRAASRRL